MRIIELETMGLRGLADRAWSLRPDGVGVGHVTVVTGPPRVGLTTFLEGIAYTAALLGVGGWVPSSDDGLRGDDSGAKIRTIWRLDDDECAFSGVVEETMTAEVTFRRDALARAESDPGLMALMSRWDHKPTTAKVVSIPARRSIGGGGYSAFSDFEFEQKQKHLSPAADKFAGVQAALARHAIGLGERARFEAVQQLFSELCGSVQLVGVASSGEPSFRLASGATVALSRLSLSEQNALVLAAVPVLLGLQRSVVLLDTPEIGLAPGAAVQWIDALRAWAPEAQWIVATRDRALVEHVEPASRIELAPMKAAT